MQKTMPVKWNSAADVAIKQLVELSCCSNGKLYSMGVKLGLIDPDAVKRESFHYHVTKWRWREQVASHYKNASLQRKEPPDLAGCRLCSSARLQFSVRLIPVAFATQALAGVTPEGKDGPANASESEFGVLGVVQELCSGLLQAELLVTEVWDEDGIYGRSLDEKVANFVAKAIKIPKLKSTAIHFPAMNFGPLSGRSNKASGVVNGWLGEFQREGTESEVAEKFKLFAAKVIKKCGFARSGSGKVSLDLDQFRLDFPPQQKSQLLDLRKVGTKGWTVATFNMELRERINRYNTAVDLAADDLGPTLKLWIARLCYYQADRDDELRQKALLKGMVQAIYYKQNKLDATIGALQEIGIRHLHSNNYPTTKAHRPVKKNATSRSSSSAVAAGKAWEKVLRDREARRVAAEASGADVD